MKNKNIIAFLAAVLLIPGSCKKALDYTPTGVLSPSDLSSPAAVEGL